MEKRVIIIGLDGVPYSILKDLAERGVMPSTRGIIEDGLFKQMTSSIPEVSSVAWSSLITGKNPAEHGIFGFTDFPQGTYRLSFPNYDNLKCPPFWNKNGARSVIINVPSTFPARDLNGVHISGFVSLDLERAVWPKSILPKLREIDYRTDVDSDKAHKSMEMFLRDLDKTLQARIDAYRYFWNFEDWQTFMLVFTGTDRLMHFLWDAYEDTSHRYHSEFLHHFKEIDGVIGEVVSSIDDDDLLIMLSDHGFERLQSDIYLNYLLRKEGFLTFQDTMEPEWSKIDYKTSAFALDPARIYINLKGKYPRGSVRKKDKDSAIRVLWDIFNSLEVDGRKVCRDIYTKDEIYHGPLLDRAPDLVLVANQGFNLRAKIKAHKLVDRDIFTGKHTQHDAFLLIKDASKAQHVPDEPSVFDIVEIMSGGDDNA